MLKIGDFSRLARVSIKTLRHYAQLGLLEPSWIDRFSGYRYYTIDQLHPLNRILALKDLGFSLQQIKKVLGDDLSAAELRGMYRVKLAELERQVQESQAQLQRVESRLRLIEAEQDFRDYDVIVKSIPSIHVAGLRRVIESHLLVPNPICQLLEELNQGGSGFSGQESILVIYHDHEYQDRNIDVEVAFPKPSWPVGKNLIRRELPSVSEMACTIQKYGIWGIQNAYQALMTWIDANGFQVSGSGREVYYLDSSAEGAKDCAIVEVQIPVERKFIPDFIKNQKEKKDMEPRFMTKPAFTAVGLLYHGKNEKNEIAQMWQAFNPRIREISHISDGAFGLCQPADENGEFSYLASMGVADVKDIPNGMQVWQVPEQHYAIFSCTLPTLQETYRYVFESWIPQSGYEYTGGLDFEYYDEDFNPESADGLMYVYIPVRKKR